MAPFYQGKHQTSNQQFRLRGTPYTITFREEATAIGDVHTRRSGVVVYRNVDLTDFLQAQKLGQGLYEFQAERRAVLAVLQAKQHTDAGVPVPADIKAALPKKRVRRAR